MEVAGTAIHIDDIPVAALLDQLVGFALVGGLDQAAGDAGLRADFAAVGGNDNIVYLGRCFLSAVRFVYMLLVMLLIGPSYGRILLANSSMSSTTLSGSDTLLNTTE